MRLLVIFADALGYHYVEDPDIRKEFEKIFQSVVPLETMLGYSSGLGPSIWTSTTPEKHNFWTLWRYNGKEMRNEVTIHSYLWIFRTIILKILKDGCLKIGKEIDLDPAIPGGITKYFEKKEFDFTKPFYDEKNPSLFEILNKSNVSWKYVFSQFLENLSRLPINKQKDEVIISLLGEFDHLGHSKGPNSDIMKNKIIEFLNWLERQRKNFDDIIIFSDHGMYPVEKRLDLICLLKEVPYKFGVDYLAFYDATMVRFWFNNSKVKDEITELLGSYEGEIITRDEFHTYSLPTGREYCDMIFLASPRTEIFPNFFHPMYKNFFKGLHGYSPKYENSSGLFASTTKVARGEGTILDVSPSILKYLGLELPNTWEGRSLYE